MTEFLPILRQVNWEIAPLADNMPDSFQLSLTQNDAKLLLGNLCDEFSNAHGPLFRATVPIENLKQYENGTYMSITHGHNGGFGAHAGFQPLSQDGISYVIYDLMGKCYSAILSEMRLQYARHLTALRNEQMKREENIFNFALSQCQIICLSEKEKQQSLEMINIQNNIAEVFKELSSPIFENPLRRFAYLQKILDWKDSVSKISLDLIDSLNIQCDNIEGQKCAYALPIDFNKIRKLYSLCRIAIEMYLHLNQLEFLFSGDFYIEERINARKKNIEDGYLNNFAILDRKIKNAIFNLQEYIKKNVTVQVGYYAPQFIKPVPLGWDEFYQSLENLKTEKELPITANALVSLSEEILKIPHNLTLKVYDPKSKEMK